MKPLVPDSPGPGLRSHTEQSAGTWGMTLLSSRTLEGGPLVWMLAWVWEKQSFDVFMREINHCILGDAHNADLLYSRDCLR